MFKFLKDKLKSTISKISGKIEKEADIEDAKEPIEKLREITETEEKKELREEIEVLKEDIKEVSEEIKKEERAKKPSVEKIKEEVKEIKEETEDVEKSFLGKIREKITTRKVSNEKFEGLFNELELVLLENNVAVEVIDKIKEDLKRNLVEKPIKRSKVEETIKDSLKNSINDLFDVGEIDLLDFIKNKSEKPYVMAFFGINGSGKTTSIAKIASMLKSEGIDCVLAASDTFRAASIEQLQKYADSLKIKMIKHDYKADPAAVAFDAIKYAKSKNIDVVLIDTAGRMHSNVNLVEEMKKIVRVAKPDLKIFVGEAITGNDCVEQAKTFNDAIGIDGIILAKADVDEKGGAFVSVSYVTKKPIIYLGTGQNYGDLKKFDSGIVLDNLGFT